MAETVPGNADRHSMKESIPQLSPGNKAHHGPLLEILRGRSTVKVPSSYDTFFKAQPTGQWCPDTSLGNSDLDAFPNMGRDWRTIRSLSARKEPSCTVGGNVNWYSHYGEQYGGSSKS